MKHESMSFYFVSTCISFKYITGWKDIKMDSIQNQSVNEHVIISPDVSMKSSVQWRADDEDDHEDHEACV